MQTRDVHFKISRKLNVPFVLFGSFLIYYNNYDVVVIIIILILYKDT